eukprot:gene4470-35013_t
MRVRFDRPVLACVCGAPALSAVGPCPPRVPLAGGAAVDNNPGVDVMRSRLDLPTEARGFL